MRLFFVALAFFTAGTALALPCTPDFHRDELKPDGVYTNSDWSSCDLSQLDLSGSQFREMELRYANLRQTKLNGADFSEGQEAWRGSSNLAGADFTDAWLYHTNFSGRTPGSGTNLAGAWIANQYAAKQVNFRNAILSGATIHWAGFDEADFTGAEMTGVKLSHFRCGKCEMPGLNFTKMKISSDLVLSFSNISKSNFSGMNLSNAWFDAVHAAGASFNGAHLHKARFDRADLRGADLRNAVLTGINFQQCDLRGADLTGATIGAWNAPDMTFFEDCKYNADTKMPAGVDPIRYSMKFEP